MNRIIIYLAILICSVALNAQIQPNMKFYYNDGSSKPIQLSDVDNIGVIKGQSTFNMKIYYQHTKNASYLTNNLDSIKIEIVKNIITNFVVYQTGSTSVKYALTEIDSIIFSTLPAPAITLITPNSGKINDIITLTGSNFGTLQGTSFVNFNGAKASSYPSWKDNQLQVRVPTLAKTGKVSVTVSGQKSNEVDFTVAVAPVIVSINPTSFAVGDQVTITGSNFGTSYSSSSISFNFTYASAITSWTDTQIICIAPAGATSGNLTVMVNGTMISNAVPFIISIPIQTVLIPAGTFQMGNTGQYSGTIFIQEVPVHQVTISRSFYMSKYEVSQALYLSLMGINPSNFKTSSDLPVERISWYDAVEFCNRLSTRDGYDKCYTINGTNVSCDWNANGYRLPTEAEWEYTCKAGTTSDYYSGNSESNLAEIAWYSGNSGDLTHTPGQKKPNKFGIYDMIGNVFEWVWDWSGPYGGGSVTDPTGPSSGTVKIIRGGSWHNGLANGMSRSSFHGWEDTPTSHSSTDGIRVVRLQ